MRSGGQLTAAQKALLGERLKRLRGRTSLRALALRSDIDDATLRRLEKGQVDPTLGTILRLVEAHGLYSIEELLSGDRFGTAVLLGADESASAAS